MNFKIPEVLKVFIIQQASVCVCVYLWVCVCETNVVLPIYFMHLHFFAIEMHLLPAYFQQTSIKLNISHLPLCFFF